MRRRVLKGLAVMAVACVPIAMSREPMPFWDIVETVRSLAADHLGRKRSDVNTVDSLFAQGMGEDAFDALMIAVQDEFGVVIPDNEIHQAKWNDPMAGLSVRRIAQMVEKRMQSPGPEGPAR